VLVTLALEVWSNLAYDEELWLYEMVTPVG